MSLLKETTFIDEELGEVVYNNDPNNTKGKKFYFDETDTIKDDVENETLYRIIACKKFKTASGREITPGTKGGYMSITCTLGHNKKCWIGDEARVSGQSKIKGNAEIFGNAKVISGCTIKDDVKVYGNAVVFSGCVLSETVKVYGNAEVYDDSVISGNVEIYDDAKICECHISGNIDISDRIKLIECTVSGYGELPGEIVLGDPDFID